MCPGNALCAHLAPQLQTVRTDAPIYPIKDTLERTPHWVRADIGTHHFRPRESEPRLQARGPEMAENVVFCRNSRERADDGGQLSVRHVIAN